MKYYISLDIGGTDIKYGIVNEHGEVVQKAKTPTDAHAVNKKLVEKLIKIGSELVKTEYVISGIGISTAGVVDTEKGEVIYAGNTLPDYIGTKLKNIMEKQFHLPTRVNNDVNAAALGEAWVGAAKDVNSFFCMTLGTGIGGAIVINKKLYKGFHYKAAEIGYLSMEKGGETFYERRASTSALIKMVQREFDKDVIDGKYIFEKARQGDTLFLSILDEWVEEVAKGIANIICVLDPELILIGGGVSKQGSFLTKKIEEKLNYYLPPNFGSTIIRAAQNANDAGLIGAVYEFVEK